MTYTADVGQVKKRRLYGKIMTAIGSICLLSGLVLIGLVLRTNHPTAALPSSQTTPGTPSLSNTALEAPTTTDSIATYKVAADLPRVLTIDSLGVRAKIMNLGVTNTGSMDTPKYSSDVGWYNGSAKPGQAGAVVLDGHVSGATTAGGVFVRLKKLKSGDTITIEKGNGAKLTYRVIKSEVSNVADVNMAKVMQPIEANKHGLNIITCAGTYDKSIQTFTQRLVVYATEVN